MIVTLLGFVVSIALAFAPLPFIWIPLLWSGLFIHRAAVAERRATKLACTNAAGILLVFALAEGILQLRPGLELSGSLSDGYFRGHESLGYAPFAENRATARRSFGDEVLYDVVYTIDQNGLRLAPPVLEGAVAECLLFFGGSFTFGEGVNDEEAMPYRVGVKTGGRFRVYNFAFHGYGAHQMLAALEDELVAGTIDCVPRLAIYLAHPDHVVRAAGFAAWDTHGPRYLRDPGGGVAYAGHFDDGLAFYGRGLLALLSQSKLLATFLSLRQPDPEASEELFVEIVGAAREHVETRHPGAEFHVILWDDANSSLSQRLASAGLRLHPIDAIVPAEERGEPRYTIPRDGHPTALLQERVASYVAREIVDASAVKGDDAAALQPLRRVRAPSPQLAVYSVDPSRPGVLRMNRRLRPAARLSADEASALLLHAQGLLDRPSRRPTRAALLGALVRMGYVQVDSINVVARAHDLILRARFEAYRPEQLARLVERDRVVFENWVHDAAVIPLDWAGQWQHCFRLYARTRRARMAGRSGTRQFAALCARVRRRITEEGPLTSADFDDPRDRSGSWWSWKPAKVALEHMWRSGSLVVAGRDNFQKRYDLTERFLPALDAARPETRRGFIDWACVEALDRLGSATPRELADYWGHLSAADADAWCRRAVASGAAVPIEIEGKRGGRPRCGVAVPDWECRLSSVPAAPEGVRLLAPFDPVLRDRARLSHLFGFDYRFEAFVPPAKRRDGYYVMPLWRGTRAIGRIDPKLDRSIGTLLVRGLRLEPDVSHSRRLDDEIHEALDGLRAWLGAERVKVVA